MADSIKSEVTQERINAMINAGRDGGATPEATPAAPSHVDQIRSDPAVDEPLDAGQPDEKPDPMAETKAVYEAKLKDLEEKLKNQMAMQSQSHKRNGEAARDRQIAEESARIADDRAKYVDQAVRKMEGLSMGLTQLAKLHPEVAGQVLQTWANDAGASDQFAIGAQKQQPVEDPRVGQLQKQLETLQRDVSGYAFEVNAGVVAATIERMVVSNPAFDMAGQLGDLDDVRERVWTAFVKQDKENPGAVSPHNPRQINDAVKKLVEAEAAREQRREQEIIKRYREKRKVLNAQAAAPTRGPSANVRAAPTPVGPSPAESKKARENRWVQQMEAVTKASRNGGKAASEIE